MGDEQILASARLTAERSPLENEKLRLEIEKLNDELRALRLPWWKRPIYIAAVFPTLLALVGAIAAFTTGYVQTQYQLVQLLREKTTKERIELDAKQQALAAEKKGYEAEKEKMAAEIAKLKKDRALALPIRYLDDIERHADYLPNAHASELALIESIKSDFECYVVPEVERRAKNAHAPAVRISLLVDLYFGTGDMHWRDQIWTLVRESAEAGSIPFEDVFDTDGPWPEKDNILVIQLLGEILPKIKWYSAVGLWEKIGTRLPKQERGPTSLRPLFSTNDAFFNFVKTLRDLALDTKARDSERAEAMRVLRPTAPHVYVVAVSKMVEETKTTDDVRFMADYRVNEYVNNYGTSSSWLAQHMRTALNFPETLDPQKWRDWRQLNKSLVAEASEPNFDTWRKNPAKYDALFASLNSPAPKTP